MHSLLKAISALALSCSSLQAAILVTFDNRTDWENFVTVQKSDDFTGYSSTGGPTTSLSFTNSAIEASITKGVSNSENDFNVVSKDLRMRIAPNNEGSDPSEITFNLNGNYNAIGLDLLLLNNSAALTSAHINIDGSSLRFIDVLGPTATGSINGFVGIIAENPVSSFIIDNGSDTSGLDDFRLSSIHVGSSVPEPSSLLFTAIGSLLCLARRKRQIA